MRLNYILKAIRKYNMIIENKRLIPMKKCIHLFKLDLGFQ